MADPRSTPPVRGLGRLVDPRSALCWVVGGVLLFTQVAAWSLATPIFGGPDEPHHTFWAGAVVGGDLSGREVADDPDRREVLVAPSIVALGYPCFAFDPYQPASCEERAVPGDEHAPVGTRAARYPPAYYALVGAPLAADAGPASVYGVRLLTALLAVGLVVWALWSVRGDWNPYLAVGVSVALTPMVLFTFAIINPSALEVAANLALWVAGVGLVVGRDPTSLIDPSGSRTAVLGVAGAALALARPLSVVWLALTAVALLLLARDGSIRVLFRRRRTWLWTGVVVAASAAAVAWLLWSGFLTTATTGPGEGLAFGGALRDSLMETDDDLVQLVGRFGWLDTPVPTGVWIVWLLVTGSLLMGGLTVAHRRSAAVIGGMVAALVVIPAVLQSVVLGTEGMIWQGRYSLPLAVGVPVSAAAVTAADRPFAPAVGRRWLAWVLGVVWVAQIAAFTGTLRRYVTGIDGPYPGISGGPWQPPLGGWTLTTVFAVAAGVFALWMWSSVQRSSVEVPAAS